MIGKHEILFKLQFHFKEKGREGLTLNIQDITAGIYKYCISDLMDLKHLCILCLSKYYFAIVTIQFFLLFTKDIDISRDLKKKIIL